MYRLKDVQLPFRLGLLVLVLTVILFGSCSSQKPLVPAVTDSTYTLSKLVQRDTVIKAPGAAAGLTISMDKLLGAIKLDYSNSHALDAQKYKLPGVKPPQPAPVPLGSSQNKQAIATAAIHDGQLQITCKCDSMDIAAKLLDKYLQTDHTRTVTLPPKEVKYIPWYIKALAGLGGVSAVVLTILAYIGVKRKLKK